MKTHPGHGTEWPPLSWFEEVDSRVDVKIKRLKKLKALQKKIEEGSFVERIGARIALWFF